MIHFQDIPTSRHSWQNVGLVASRGAVNFRVCGIDRLGQIQPSDLGCEESVHHAARPLITRITHTEGCAEESRGDTADPLFYSTYVRIRS